MAQRHISNSGFAHAVFLLVFFQFYYAATDTISLGQQVTVSKRIVSAGDEFELGFFLTTSTNSAVNYYLGIWFKKVPSDKIVWVSNRDSPFTSSAVLTISRDGNLVIEDGKVRYMVTNISANSSTSATLLRSGNLVLRDVKSNVLWQSFDFPTDTYLAGMKIGYDRNTRKTWSLVSWKASNDPSPGDFSMMLDPNGTSQMFIRKGTRIHWTSGAWNGQFFSLFPELRSWLNMVSFSYVLNENTSYFSYGLDNSSTIQKLWLDVNGQIRSVSWSETGEQLGLVWAQPRIQCEVYGYCGAFAFCTDTILQCECLSGFEPLDSNHWAIKNYSEGCTRKASLQCSNGSLSNASDDRFIATGNALAAAPLITIGVSFQECESACLNNCMCTAFAYSNNSCSAWQGDLSSLKQLSIDNSSEQDLYIRLAASEFRVAINNGMPKTKETGGKNIETRNLWIIATSTVSCTILASYAFIYWMRKKKRSEKGEDLLSFDFSVGLGARKYELKNDTGTIEGRKKVEIPLFSLSSVSSATNDFSSANKLGEGGFGPVYKGKLLNGHEVAVKRLSRRSGQGWEELKNEAMLIARLQHKNLVKVLGCCIEGDEKILIYEYLPNKSLDLFLFGPTKHGKLDWGTRVRIIEGISQGILYLHQFSRVQIIHRDLKASNILLDKDMNPKISDFGMARIFGGKGSEATNRIVGTYGYMSPEYALQGIFSVKSDVFSFGVLLLEILSGRKNTGFYHSDSLNLLGYAWDLWRNNRSLELMDPTLSNISCSANAALRYINIALLCVQEHASDRPNMSDVISMLSSEGAILPIPKQPAFSNVRSMLDPCQFRGNEKVLFSGGEMTISIMEAR